MIYLYNMGYAIVLSALRINCQHKRFKPAYVNHTILQLFNTCCSVKSICFAFLSVILFNSALRAQPSGQLSGFVRDARTREPLIGVTIQVEGTDLGSISDTKGFYAIQAIPARTYTVTASYVGYQAATQYNVVVRSGGNPELNFELQEAIGELKEVTIEASPFQKLVETPNSIQRLSQEEIATYPGGNNDIAKVVQSLPGVSGSVGFRNDVIIRGGAPNENVYYLDGVEIPNINHFATQGSAGGPVGLLNVSFIEGVTLSTSSFPAPYDNVLSGVLQFDQRTGDPQKEGRTSGWVPVRQPYAGRAAVDASDRFSGQHHFYFFCQTFLSAVTLQAHRAAFPA